MDTIAGLIAIGFTEYEARIYQELLRHSPATGYQLSKAAGIPRSMVYEALGRLTVRGAALKTEEGRVTLYRPLPPHVLLQRHEAEYRDLLDGLSSSLRALYTAQDESHVWSISGEEAALSYAQQMIREADSELFLVLDDRQLATLSDEACAASRRGVALGVLLTGQGTLACGEVVRHPPLESQLQNLAGMLVVVVDSRETLIADRGLEMIATITRSPNLVLIARQFVWMELFAQRIYGQLGDALLDRLEPGDRQILTSLSR